MTTYSGIIHTIKLSFDGIEEQWGEKADDMIAGYRKIIKDHMESFGPEYPATVGDTEEVGGKIFRITEDEEGFLIWLVLYPQKVESVIGPDHGEILIRAELPSIISPVDKIQITLTVGNNNKDENIVEFFEEDE